MYPRLPRFLSACLLWAAAAAHGAGLGELTLHSRLGQPLRAEVALTLGEGEAPASACFGLVPLGSSDLPVVTAGQVKLVRIGDGHRLLVTSPKPLADPLAVLALRAGCGIDLQREYVLMPQTQAAPEPVTLAEAVSGTPAPRQLRSRPTPDASPEASPPPPKRRPRPEKSGGDRLVLSADPAAARPGDSPLPGSLPELEERMLKLETTLHHLHEEVNRLDQVLALKAESLATQEKLQQAKKQVLPEVVPAVFKSETLPPALTPAADGESINWLELLVSMLAGGSLAALGTHQLTRWRERKRLDRVGDIDELAVQPKMR